jgi:predicted RNA methylase
VKERLGNRRTSGDEQYYTPLPLAKNLVGQLLTANPSLKAKPFLEPSGGTGNFINALEDLGVSNILSFDIHPKHPGVKRADFLAQKLKRSDYVAIGNPPFGRNNQLSVPFFNHAANFATHIAFLVPRSWRKWSVINRLHPNFHLVSDTDVEVIYESDAGEPIAIRNDLRSCFQLWERKEQPRQKISVPTSGLISKVSPAEADIAFRCFGFGAGRLYRDFERKPNTTLMFLAVREPWVIELLEGLDYSKFAHNTAYTKAVSFQEINYLINERLWGNGFKTGEVPNE